MEPPRRVITGLDAQGRSCVIIDGSSKMVIWSTNESPADNGKNQDAGGGNFSFPTEGSRFIYSDFPPGQTIDFHATDTTDYIVVISGEVVFITETGETRLRAGDVIVDRGVMHGWRNDSDAPCRILNVLVPSRPVGKGATIAGELPIS